MKKILFVLLLLLTTLSASAQNFQRRGFALGADRDTLLYIIASPFDNWFVNFSAGIQTFSGNELVASARVNKLNYVGRVEIGKWIIPDIAVSGRVSIFNVDGQTKYGLQPFIDMSIDDSNANGYYPYHAHAMALMGYVTFDWTNFIKGYEVGKQKHLHIYTPVGLGMSMLFGQQRNPRGEVGSFRKNWELAFSAGLGFEYVFSQEFALNLLFDFFVSESTWDWSPYDNSYSIFDKIPSVAFGAKFNLLNSVRKFNPRTRESRRVKTYHEFLTVGSPGMLQSREVEVRKLSHAQDSLSKAQDSLMDLIIANNGNRDALLRKYDSLADEIDAINKGMRYNRHPENMLAELLDFNEMHGLPAVVVYFQLDRYELDYNANKRLQSFAREVNRLDDSLTFYLLGAADSATGTVKHNIWLSQQRCNVVYKRLVDDNKVNKNRLIVTPLGGITDYEPQENNRMGMLILRTPETEEIVNRWLATGSSGLSGGVSLRDADSLANIHVNAGNIEIETTEGVRIVIYDEVGNEVINAVSQGKNAFAVKKGRYTIKVGDRTKRVIVE